MKTLLISFNNYMGIIGILLFQTTCAVIPNIDNEMHQTQFQILTGLDVLIDNDFSALKGKRVGLITNQTGLDQGLTQNMDIFVGSDNVELKAIFSPEHGLFGSASAGEKITSDDGSTSGIPVHSLYGSTRKPTKAMLEGIDILLYDIQDTGIRSYTYISTMGLAMEAAAEQGLEFMVLDRPNPMGLGKIEGNVLDMRFSSFIGQYPIPYVYGLTCGELANMINECGWLNSNKCDLTIIKMKNYDRDSLMDQLEQRWVPTSPHVPESRTPAYMVATGILGELGVFSNGVGYTTPFMTMAAPWIHAETMAENMNALKLEGVMFRPIRYKPYYASHEGIEIGGVQIHITDLDKVHLMPIQFYFLQEHHYLYPEKNPFEMATDKQIQMFDKALGTDRIRKIFSRSFKVKDIQDELINGLDDYNAFSTQYHLYD